MARIKFVLNERRLGLMAAAAPLIDRPLPKVPFTPSGRPDPAAGIEALNALPVGEHLPGSVVRDREVAREEVEARDEGFGGGKEAEEFVEHVVVKEGHVERV